MLKQSHYRHPVKDEQIEDEEETSKYRPVIFNIPYFG